MLSRIWQFVKAEAVLCVAAVCALVTMLFVPLDAAYMEYIDFRVLCLLLCLMAVVEGFVSCGAFRWLANQLLKRSHGGRMLSIILVLLPFFCSMLVTNDVALLTFVPFTLLLLEKINCPKAIIPMLVLQTIAANLGSMATPVGNPQNLYLYATYNLSAGTFFSAVLPLTAVSLTCLTVAALPVLPKQLSELELDNAPLQGGKKLIGFLVMFLLCLLTVFRFLPFELMTVLVLVGIAVLEPKLLKKLDFFLLLTFVCFFVVSGNLGRMEAVSTFLQSLLSKNALLTAVGASQVISNVPAAVLLSTFAEEWKPLLQGVNIGGLGTPIASLASLITLKLYLRYPGAKAGKFLLIFTAANIFGLAILLTVSAL